MARFGDLIGNFIRASQLVALKRPLDGAQKISCAKPANSPTAMRLPPLKREDF